MIIDDDTKLTAEGALMLMSRVWDMFERSVLEQPSPRSVCCGLRRG